MSYCRFSSDDFKCDVYVYEDVQGGFTTHVAGNRIIYSEPLPPEIPCNQENMRAWVRRESKVSKIIDASGREDIELPYAGESFNDVSAAECADRLESLRSIGYIVPQYAIDALRTEAV